jgi:ribosomal protein S18 acetylase RimI-like enzyme
VNDSAIRILDVTDEVTFSLLPPCADPGFDHRSCDYWEDEIRGSKAARAAWWEQPRPMPAAPPRRLSDNPFAPDPAPRPGFNPFAPDGPGTSGEDFNPFAPEPEAQRPGADSDRPRKLRLLGRGAGVFGSYAKVLLLDETPAAYAQFGPLSAYPRARQIRELYPRLPSAPLPAVITCIATTPAARGQGLARRLITAVLDDLTERGFAATETYPDLTLETDQASAAKPDFWIACGFELVAPDERYPVMRRELG